MNFIDWETAKSIALILGTLFAGMAVWRIDIKFDINEFIKRRDEKRKIKLQNLCNHMELIKDGDKFYFHSYVVSPPGTVQSACQRCGMTTYQHNYDYLTKMWENNLKEFISQEKKFERLAKKMGLI